MYILKDSLVSIAKNKVRNILMERIECSFTTLAKEQNNCNLLTKCL